MFFFNPLNINHWCTCQTLALHHSWRLVKHCCLLYIIRGASRLQCRVLFIIRVFSPWPAAVVGSLCCWTLDRSPSIYIWGERLRDIHSCVTCLHQIGLRKSIPPPVKTWLSSKLKIYLGQEHVTVHSNSRRIVHNTRWLLRKNPPSNAVSSQVQLHP